MRPQVDRAEDSDCDRRPPTDAEAESRGSAARRSGSIGAMDDQLRSFLAEVHTIAVVGCSRRPFKAAHAIPRELQATGYRIVPVTPRCDELLGERTYPRLADVDVPVDLVDVFRPADEAPGIVHEAAAIGAPRVWLQLGIVSPAARVIAEEAGIAYVEDRCLGVDVARFGLRPAS